MNDQSVREETRFGRCGVASLLASGEAPSSRWEKTRGEASLVRPVEGQRALTRRSVHRWLETEGSEGRVRESGRPAREGDEEVVAEQ